MSNSIHSALHSTSSSLHALYAEHYTDVIQLQKTVVDDILPGLVDECDADGGDRRGWEEARSWLGDKETIFRILRRQKFTTSFALESIRENLLWRLTHIPPLSHAGNLLHALPRTVRDPFGHPILVFKLSVLNPTSSPPGSSKGKEKLSAREELRGRVIDALERLRLHLRVLNVDNEGEGAERTLQYVLLLDLQGASIQSMNIDLLTWYLRELYPRFPGMLAAVFVLNYSWAHSGIWSIAKRMLPESILSRVFFPTSQELVEYFGNGCLPSDYGGTLPPLADSVDPMFSPAPSPSPSPPPSTPKDPPPPSTPKDPSPPSPPPLPPQTLIPEHPPTQTQTPSRKTPLPDPHSHLNPTFGYPTPTNKKLTHLLRTLLYLFCQKYGGLLRPVVYGLVALASAGLVVIAGRRGLGRVLVRGFERSFVMGSRSMLGIEWMLGRLVLGGLRGIETVLENVVRVLGRERVWWSGLATMVGLGVRGFWEDILGFGVESVGWVLGVDVRVRVGSGF
ncbi:hypothetical protein JAAARDRAFT_59749 [Jaapia argillacea MUCL 33604]|uniref:CRAL-TRIO domain-containing protein n=1 Tax=Jaapia argillacea MUCL 33604 TaxID=933084 RepID=A0A067PLS7_9AGAM|nr:hypothetical protein JAAARDRAFT_59749 [Jaapia argillacea MUCL 33604]